MQVIAPSHGGSPHLSPRRANWPQVAGPILPAKVTVVVVGCTRPPDRVLPLGLPLRSYLNLKSAGMEPWTEAQKAAMYEDGFLVVRSAVQPELVAAARTALEGGAVGSAPEIMALLYESALAPFLRAGLRGADFHQVKGSQAGANAPRPVGTRCMQTGWPESDVPFFGWCGHVDGIWSGGAAAPQSRDEPEFDEAKWYGEPAVNGHNKSYGEGLNLQLFSALVGVSLSEQQLDGAGQIGVLKGAHKPFADFYQQQRAAGGPLGPGGPHWPREDFNAPNVSGSLP